MANESGVANTIDPLGGSYYIEALTDEIVEKVEAYLAKIEDMGGMVRAIEKGYPQKEIQDSAYKYQKDVENGERIVVGVNKYVVEEAPPEGLLRVNPQLRKIQIEKLAKVKAERDNAAVEHSLRALREGASRPDVNLMPLIVDAVSRYATLGEICGVLRQEFGEYKESIVL